MKGQIYLVHRDKPPKFRCFIIELHEKYSIKKNVTECQSRTRVNIEYTEKGKMRVDYNAGHVTVS